MYKTCLCVIAFFLFVLTVSARLDMSGAELAHRRRVRHQADADVARTMSSRGKSRPCPKMDVSQKAYMADTVVVARTDAVRVRPRARKYSVLFKVQRKLKSPGAYPFVGDVIELFFLNETRTNPHRCSFSFPTSSSPSKLVRANVQQSREYLLFLDSSGARNYTPVAVPEPVRRRTVPKVVEKVTSPDFRIKPPKVVRIEDKLVMGNGDRKRRLRLVCKSGGLPIPVLSWSRNGSLVHPNQRIRITYKKRSSALFITEPTKHDQGRYECKARSVGGKTASAHFDFHDFSVHSENSEATDRLCNHEMAMHFCLNGGTCHYVMNMQEMYCVCPDSYTGHRCDSKLPSQSSMYPSTPSLYTCKMGLSTRYFC